MDFVELNGTAMRYELRGEKGPLVVLIHEMGGVLENWDEVVPALGGDYRVLRYDCRGFGMSERVRGDLNVTTLADDLAALLDHVGEKQPAVIAGCAVGAAIALVFAARHRERAAGVVAMSPALDMKPEDRPARLSMLETVASEGMRAIMDGALGAGYPQVLRDRNPERFRRFRARWLGNDPESFIAHYRMLIYMDIANELRAIRCPTLGVGGSLDVFRTPDYVREVLSPIPGVEFVTIESCHHQPAATPEPVAAVLKDFLRRHAPA